MIWLKNVEEYIEYKKWFYREFLDAYRNRVNEFYKDQYIDNPNQFPFMEPTSVITIFRDYDMVNFLFPSPSAKDEYDYKIDEFNSWDEYKEIHDLPEHIKEQRLLDIAGISDYTSKDLSWYGESDDPHPNYDNSIPKYQGNSCADKHYKSMDTVKSKDNGLVQKDQFEEDSLIKKVNNEEFQYELNESIQAYNAGLYLASTAVSAVTIETLLKITFTSHYGEEALPRRYYILNLADKLHDGKIIDNRLYHRIKSFNELRRGASHSKTGEMSDWDASQGIALIKEIVELLF